MCGVSDDRCTGFSAVRGLFGSSMVDLLVVLFVPLFLSFLAMPDLCCFLRVTPACQPHVISACQHVHQTFAQTLH